MGKVSDHHDPLNVRLLKCSPTQLRMIADRMENSVTNRTLPGEKILYPFADGIMLLHEPNVTRTQLESRAVQEGKFLAIETAEQSP